MASKKSSTPSRSNGSYSYTKPVTEKSAGTKGDFVAGNSERVGDNFHRRLGLTPNRQRSDSSSTPLPSRFKGTCFDCGKLKETILDQSNTVKIRPVLLTVSGLQGSGHTHAITHLMKHYVDKSPYTPISRKTYIPKTAKGIIYYNLVAVGLRHLQIVEMTSDFSCSFGIMSAFQKKVQDKANPEVPLLYSITRNTRSNSVSLSSFDDPDLEVHLENVYKHISQFEHFPKGDPTQGDKSMEELELSEEEMVLLHHLNKLPDGAALINIWNIDISKSSFDILQALFGHLYNSNTWLFIDIQQNLDKPPEGIDQPPTDGSFTVKWRSRLHYSLRASKMSHGGHKGDRKRVCTLFAKHDNDTLSTKLEELEEKVRQGARQIGVSDLLEPQVQAINLSDSEMTATNNYNHHLYLKFCEVICKRSYEDIPYSWVFLRSLFYCSHKIYISKIALKEKAKECGIIDKSFEEFCRFYMSFGNIIDLTCINPEQQIIVLAPVEFLRSLDKILHPSEEITKLDLISNGVVSEETCRKIFEYEGEWGVYIDALISIGLAAKVSRDCESITLPSEQRNDALFYIPQMRKTKVISSPDEVHDADCPVYFITSSDSPHIYKQARLVKFLLSKLPDAKLIPCPERNQTIIHDISIDVDIKFISFSPATLILIKKNNDNPTNDVQHVYTSVVNAFHSITKSCEAGLIKYSFIVPTDGSNSPFHCRHMLPNDNLCTSTSSSLSERQKENLKLWNQALTENPIPDDNKIDEDLTYAQKSYIAQEAESHPELIPDLIEVLGFQKDDPKYKKFKGGTLVMRMLTDWEVSAHEKMEECPSKRSNLAEELLKKSKSVSLNAGLLLKLSKELDYQACMYQDSSPDSHNTNNGTQS